MWYQANKWQISVLGEDFSIQISIFYTITNMLFSFFFHISGYCLLLNIAMQCQQFLSIVVIVCITTKMLTTQRAALAAAKTNQTKQMRTCCNCWHIKCGIIILGLIELAAVALILSGIFAKIISKSRKFNCDQEFVFR